MDKAAAALIPAGIAAVLVISLASCGSSNAPANNSSVAATAGSTATGGSSAAATAPAHGVAVVPSAGQPMTTFSLRFTAPASTRTVSGSRIGFAVALSAPASTGCVGVRSVEAPAATKGDPVAVTLNPAQLGGKWCIGVHHVRVIESESPVCQTGTMCPQFVRVIGTVGTATFRVTS